ncbi:LytR/AlgR family response regulator transcription factor [Mucilaginibacter segetis]|uniref:Response regulator transcription factor n=1 Tax=Mucilaginibacter segetis TaxID=2793071 RepID=A0A934PSE1_9SPHI|nr:LytTR family DNA-binding domain-containing protein [Mucilaginibacter segetis]MBK0379214.1 response regulator transcription factor [Mucilaginibacter segetis]
MKNINCLIIDDEPIARDILRTYIGRMPELVLVGECKNATEAYEALHRYPVDVVFLDIQMPVITGTTFLRSLQKPPLVVFTTAYAEHAVEGFELNAVDYLLKPITFDRFCQAIQKLQQKPSGPALPQERPTAIFVRQDTRLVKVDFDELVYIQAERDFCSLYLSGGLRLLVGMHLKLLEDLLPSDQFMRVHRSFMININKIKAIKGNMIEISETEIPIGSNYRDSLFERLRLQR